jgi:type II secretion system protein G
VDITFNCDSCGQHIVVDEAGAGLPVQCPKCGQPLTVPRQSPERSTPVTSAPAQASASTSETKKCPYCAETIKREAKICRFCGLDLATGEPRSGRSNRRTLLVLLGVGIIVSVLWLFRIPERFRTQLEESIAESTARGLADARANAAKADIKNYSTALDLFELDNGFYPTTEQGLQALITPPSVAPTPTNWKGPYLFTPVRNDPWGKPYIYKCPDDHVANSYDLCSFWPDTVGGDDDDICNHKQADA